MTKLTEGAKLALIEILKSAPIACQNGKSVLKLIELGIVKCEKDDRGDRSYHVPDIEQLRKQYGITELDFVDPIFYALDHCTMVQFRGIYGYVCAARNPEESLLVGTKGFDSVSLMRKGLLENMYREGKRRLFKPVQALLDKWDAYLELRPHMAALLEGYTPKVRKMPNKQRQAMTLAATTKAVKEHKLSLPCVIRVPEETTLWREKKKALAGVSKARLDEEFSVFLNQVRGFA